MRGSVMQIQHIDLFVTSHSQPEPGDLPAEVDQETEHIVPIIGTSGVWEAWAVPCSGLGDAAGFQKLCAEPIPDDCSHVKLKVQSSAADKRVGLRIYVLSQ